MGAAGEAFPRRQRLCRRTDFLRVQRTGEKHMMRHFLVFVASSKELGEGAERQPDAAGVAEGAVVRPVVRPVVRLGVTVTRRVGGAVVRNRIKRYVREAFRRLRGRFMHSCDMVWIAKQGAGGIGYGEVVADMTALGDRLAHRQRRNRA